MSKVPPDLGKTLFFIWDFGITTARRVVFMVTGEDEFDLTILVIVPTSLTSSAAKLPLTAINKTASRASFI